MTTTPAPAKCRYGTGWKRRYETRREAEVAAWVCLAQRGRWLRAFHCHGCGGWHLTSWPHRARERRRGR
jgi:hypothetical protein